MVQCIYCKTKTGSFDSGLPICSDCANRAEAQVPPEEQNIRAILQRELITATARAHVATDAFNAILDDIPSALPQPDGTQRIHNVYRELSIARLQMMEAHSRLGDYLVSGIIPEDLASSGKS
jgi:hypothetical protein